jgi:pimeloyl-ACP methyl ester carboxylesterase
VADHPEGIHVVHHHAEQAHAGRPLVVLVHGSLDRATTFARVVRRLQDLHVITYDRRGYNRSREAGGLARSDGGRLPFDQHVDDLVELCGRRSVVVGHSFGGDIALAAAGAAPDRVAAVGAYEPPMPWADWWPRRSGREVSDEDPGARAEAFFRRVVGDESWNRLPRRSREERRADGPALVAELAALRSGGEPFDLRKLQVPVVLGRGESSVPHHVRAVEEMAGLVDGARVVVIAGASHGAHVSHPEEFASFVRLVVDMSQTPEGV